MSFRPRRVAYASLAVGLLVGVPVALFEIVMWSLPAPAVEVQSANLFHLSPSATVIRIVDRDRAAGTVDDPPRVTVEVEDVFERGDLPERITFAWGSPSVTFRCGNESPLERLQIDAHRIGAPEIGDRFLTVLLPSGADGRYREFAQYRWRYEGEVVEAVERFQRERE